jgi:hypothetical protein
MCSPSFHPPERVVKRARRDAETVREPRVATRTRKRHGVTGAARREGKVDRLLGPKENVIIEKLIPAATGLKRYRTIEIGPSEKVPKEAYERETCSPPSRRSAPTAARSTSRRSASTSAASPT